MRLLGILQILSIAQYSDQEYTLIVSQCTALIFSKAMQFFRIKTLIIFVLQTLHLAQLV